MIQDAKLTNSKDGLHLEQYIFAFALVFLALGGLGGSLQPSRIFCLLLLPYVIRNLLNLRSATVVGIATVSLVFTLVSLSFLSIAWSSDRITSAGYSLVFFINVIPLLYAATSKPNHNLKLIPIVGKSWLVALFATTLVAVFELKTGYNFSFDLEGRGGELWSLIPFASVFFGNFNNYSMFLTLSISILVIIFFDQRTTPLVSRLIFLAVLFSLIPLLFNASRGALISCGILLLYACFAKAGMMRLILFAAFAVLAHMVFGGFSDSLLQQLLFVRFTDFLSDLYAGTGRLAILQAGALALLDTYGLGVGAGASAAYLSLHFPGIIPNPHNLFLEIALNFGLIGIFAFSCYVVLLIFASLRIRVRQRSQSNLLALSFLLLPLMGVIQSHLTGHTYFWLWFASMIVVLQGRYKCHIPDVYKVPDERNEGANRAKISWPAREFGS